MVDGNLNWLYWSGGLVIITGRRLSGLYIHTYLHTYISLVVLRLECLRHTCVSVVIVVLQCLVVPTYFPLTTTQKWLGLEIQRSSGVLMQTKCSFSPVQRDDGLACNSPTAVQAVCILTVFQSVKYSLISISESDAEAGDNPRLIDVWKRSESEVQTRILLITVWSLISMV